MYGKLIIYALIIVFNFSSIISHKCGTDLLINKLNLTNNKNFVGENRRRLSDTFYPIRVKIDYTLLQNQNNRQIISNTNYQNFKNNLDKIPEYLAKIISVNRETFNEQELLYEINDNCQYSNKIHFRISTFNYDISSYDLIVYPVVDSYKEFVSDNVIAAASHCFKSPASGRPIVGIVLLNNNLNTKRDLEYYIKNSIFHEFFHVLGFNIGFFEGKNYVVNNVAYLNTSKLLAKAKLHFGCDSMKGLRLENQGEKGSIGSHWDARFMQGELMISEDYSEVVLSDMTLAFLEDLGYYKVNYYTGGLFRFGKNQGCSFLEKECVYSEGTLFSNEFCVEPGKAFCTGSHTSKGSCYIAEYRSALPTSFQYFSNPKVGGKVMTDYCPISFYNKADDNYNYPMNCVYGKKEYSDEVIGSNSICFETSVNLNINTTACYKMSCDRTNKKIIVYIGSQKIECDGEQKIINVNSSDTLNCPDYNMVCTSSIWCNNMFECIDKQSVTDENTYLYNTNYAQLKQMDNKKLNLYTSSKYSIQFGSNDNNIMVKYTWKNFIAQFILLIFAFM